MKGYIGAKTEKNVAANEVWPRPSLVILPEEVSGSSNPVISLNGKWKFTMNPPDEFWLNGVDPSDWQDISVPGECFMQGFDIESDREYPYKRLVDIPADFIGKRVLLRFEGVYSYARVWVNGIFVRDHNGGFTAFDCDITDCIEPGRPAWITVGVTDKSDDISYASGYAKHKIGGILRNVKLVALPRDYIKRFHAVTDFDESYDDAVLRVIAEISFNEGDSVTLFLSLKDPEGRSVPIAPERISLEAGSPQAVIDIPVKSPLKWDAEHPNLYTFEGSLLVGDRVVERVTRKIGFRKVEKRENRVFVNGREIKLRGACVHDIHPLMGRATTDELDAGHAAKFAEANINFIRTSHYPKTDAFLDACDRLGIYVEEETAVTWQSGGLGLINTVDNPDYTPAYLSQFAEMVEKDLSHPSIIVWSLGNETKWGINFTKELDYIRAEDNTRLTIVSWGDPSVDINSWHYPEYGADLAPTPSQPTLLDEFAHVCCYNTETLKRDPGARNFWGESIKLFWEKIMETPGCLGGAIWAATDEVFQSPVNNWCGGYGEWGIIDGWRREKPEFWLVKKAFSPVRIEDAPVGNPGSGKPLNIPIKNWFDHTNLSEIIFEWRVGEGNGRFNGPDVAPHESGVLTIPARDWRDGEVLNIKCFKAGRFTDEYRLIDEYNLPVGNEGSRVQNYQASAPSIVDDGDRIIVSGRDYKIIFCKKDGQIESASYKGSELIIGGPRLDLGSVRLQEWSLRAIGVSPEGDEAVVTIKGSYGDVEASFAIRMDGMGSVTVEYTIVNAPSDASEVGIIFDLPDSVEKLCWERRGLWSVYPPDHIGRNKGVAYRRSGNNDSYRVEPKWPWSHDMKNYFLFGSDDPGDLGSNDFRSRKENIYFASAVMEGSGYCVRVESDSSDAVRMEHPDAGKAEKKEEKKEERQEGKQEERGENKKEKRNRISMLISNEWSYKDIAWGNYTRPVSMPHEYANIIRLRLTEAI